MNIIDLLSDDDDDDLLMGSAQPIFAPRAALAPATIAASAAIDALSTTAVAEVAATTSEQDSKPHATILIDDDDALLMGAAQPIFVSSAPLAAFAPATAAAPTTTSPPTTAAAAVVAAPEQDSKPHVTILGSCHLSIVGTQYHAGKVSMGETVKLEREPTNPHDRNAVRVDNMKGQIVGHIKRTEAAKLSPLLAQMNNITLNATVPSPSTGGSIPVTVNLLTTSSRPMSNFELEPMYTTITSHLRHHFHRTKKAPNLSRVTPSPTEMNRTPLQALATGLADIASASEKDQKPQARQDTSTSSPDRATSLQALTASLTDKEAGLEVEMTNVDWEGAHEQLDEMFDQQSENRLEQLPNYSMPPQLQNVELFDYQIDGIKWLIHQERNDTALPPFCKEILVNGKKRWLCTITKAVMLKPPKPICGGILADDMGLGKTIQTIGLILSNPPLGQSYPFVRRGLSAKPAPRCTLIICPVSVISNWKIQLNKFVNNRVDDKVVKLRVYHGAKRECVLDVVRACGVDILVTSYHTIVADFKKDLEAKKRGTKTKKQKLSPSIFDLIFHRIVLDEAHIIRNSQTGFFKAITKLHADRKLCLTGTPFVNKPDDIHSLLSFLGVQPLCDKNVFKKVVTQQIASRKEAGLATIRTTMVYIALRRKKADVESTIQLVSKKVQHRYIKFPEGDHKTIHDVLFASARSAFLGLLRLGDSEVSNNFMALLELLLRVRQACCHADLVPIERRQNATEVFEEVKRRGLDNMTEEECEALLARIQGTFQQEPLQECAVCFNEMEEESAVILRTCKHIFCQPCLNQVHNCLCPFCRVPYTEDDMVNKAEAQKAVGAKKRAITVKSTGGKGGTGRSPKIQAMLDAIDEMVPDEKGVIFSQWTSYLDIIQAELRQLGHTYTRIDGSMSADERIDAMEKFDTEGCDSLQTPRFILCSLHACGTGINLTRGNVVFMMDCWWNRAAEDQAMDRVHRIGQKRPVRVMRFLMKDSIEERMVALQDSKAALGKGALEKLRPDEKRKARLTALKDLFQVEDVEELWH